MRITVFGATGGTGRHVVEQALEAGHQVTAVVRDPARLPVPPRDGLTVATARLDDRAAVQQVVTGADAVVDALGARGTGPTTFREDTARIVTAAMRDAGVRRLVVVSASGAHTTGDSLPIRLLVKPLLGWMLRHQFADMRAMEEVVHANRQGAPAGGRERAWLVPDRPRRPRRRCTGGRHRRRGARRVALGRRRLIGPDVPHPPRPGTM
jgi:nucleoside-diphosphate-sugar epimerase